MYYVMMTIGVIWLGTITTYKRSFDQHNNLCPLDHQIPKQTL